MARLSTEWLWIFYFEVTTILVEERINDLVGTTERRATVFGFC